MQNTNTANKLLLKNVGGGLLTSLINPFGANMPVQQPMIVDQTNK
jgi:hypothetical protein